eukprot:933953-Rhodomonas_salina.3
MALPGARGPQMDQIARSVLRRLEEEAGTVSCLGWLTPYAFAMRCPVRSQQYRRALCDVRY